MNIISSFIIVGLFSALASIIYDTTKLTSGHITCILLCAGIILGFLGIYDIWIEKFGYGLATSITSFGNSLFNASYSGYKAQGFIGLLSNMFETTSAGICGVVISSFIVSLFCKPKD